MLMLTIKNQNLQSNSRNLFVSKFLNEDKLYKSLWEIYFKGI
jgi:hypothetical protein